MPTIPLDLDGYTELPPGRIANVVTYFEMRVPPAPPPASDARFRVTLVQTPTVDWYRRLHRRIGEQWLWFSRTLMDDDALAERLGDEAIAILALEQHDDTIGFAELDRSIPGVVEIAMFGVVPEATGTGAARCLMDRTLAYAWRPETKRIWLHTCTFDHPAAIPFYSRSGFRPFRIAIEVTPDPRLTGHLPRHAGPHVPLIEPE